MAKPLDFAYDFGDPDDYLTFVSRGWTVVPGDKTDVIDVQVGAATYPKRFETYVTSTADDFACLVMFLADTNSNDIHLAAVLSSAMDTDDAIDRISSVRPLAWWKQQGILGLAFSKDRVSADDKRDFLGAIFDLDQEEVGREEVSKEYAKERHPSQSGSQSRRRMSDVFSEEIAGIYRTAWEAGENPTQAVARHYQKPYSTAARWVGESRKRGHLGPADGSRGGETTTSTDD
ncbi:hypothetical protein ASF88_12165 [Leifsonia sp. Leaf336]|uniref:hypothetical protein n=1 Tax=Leifsonia sp. Leaf336 TaxID=1736341 RepID=UPI0006FAEBBE|nr:hypothetical protein [Leifsonia sp. Leaf336]KQR52299.1 hypothetical protein ASF88_12165 [Leifsonia sp. Leaf336]